MSLVPILAGKVRPFSRPEPRGRRRTSRREIRAMTLRKPAGETQDWSACIADIARRRDRARFSELFLHFAPRLKAFFFRLGVSSGAAEDLAQDVMLVVWRKADYFDPARASAATWIFTIARNLRVDMSRREGKPALSEEFLDLADEPGPGESAIALERETRVRAALAQLPGDQADVIRLSFFEDRPHAEIANALDIPLGTVKSRIRLAMNRLRTLVGELA
jgi:RNA polymerase sigma-70 factor, ECF subfamily